MKRDRKLSIIKVLVYLFVERVHRRVYDKIYRQDHKITRQDRLILYWYALLWVVFKDFRPYLKRWKPILIRAYNLKRLSLYRQIAFWSLRKVNVARYSSYID